MFLALIKCKRNIRITLTNKMHYFLLIYFNSKPLHVSSRLAAHHQEDQLCINSNWYNVCHAFMLIGCWQDPASERQVNINAWLWPFAVYTELILLMMSSKPARNM
jgi:hypothetical protein